MSITLPTSPRPNGVTPALQVFGRVTTPLGGSRLQFLERPGSRYRANVSLPIMEYDTAREWIGSRLRASAEGSTVVFQWPQPTQASLGAPLVNGGSQTGTSLICDGFTAGAVIPALAYFSFSVSGHYYLHCVTTQATANGSGQVTLNIAPMLRVSPADNAALDFVTPKIEGFMDTGDVEWTEDVLFHNSVSFTIMEDR